MAEVIGLVAGFVSVILGLLAIGIALYFYTQTKNTEKDVSGLLEGIRAQTETLQKIVGKQMDRLIRGVTEQPSSDFSVVYEMIGAIREIPTSVITLLQAPSSSTQAAQFWRQEAIKGYIGAYYYAALTNITNQYFLPALDQLEQGNLIKKVVDASHADFEMLDRWFSTLDQQELIQSPLYHLHQEALNTWKQFVKDAMAVYSERAASAPGQTS